MDATNSDITTGDTEYENQDDVSLPGDEIEPDADTDPDMNDRQDVRWVNRHHPNGMTPTDAEIEHHTDDFPGWRYVTETTVKHQLNNK